MHKYDKVSQKLALQVFRSFLSVNAHIHTDFFWCIGNPKLLKVLEGVNQIISQQRKFSQLGIPAIVEELFELLI